MIKKIEEAVEYLGTKIPGKPRFGLITGTGLGNLTDKMDVHGRFPYEEIPHFPRSTVAGHSGQLVYGTLSNRPVLAMEGRFHIYEGYTPQEITFPVRVMSRLGIHTLLISSAAGGLNTLFHAGELMVVADHINLTGNNPLIGPNLDSFGPRFPDMVQVYDPDLISLAREKALEERMLLREGVYVSLVGPSLETPAETRFLKMIGADAVGMSTVSEVIAGVHCGMKILAIVVITNVNLPDCMEKVSLENIIKTADEAGTRLGLLWEKIIAALPDRE
ncbi:MAG: purine-nucleoside phosphorylase [Deltaproteobacteria bacterium]|nr:purine-nucleoside phosphorylase [Deltaproteobacteria bacterium]MBW2205586.1 purine-nucleoside phosphorylase [Deltaproteobacteria bacterium]